MIRSKPMPLHWQESGRRQNCDEKRDQHVHHVIEEKDGRGKNSPSKTNWVTRRLCETNVLTFDADGREIDTMKGS